MQGTNVAVRRRRVRTLSDVVRVIPEGRMTTAATASLSELEARLSRLESCYEALEETLALPSPAPATNGGGARAAMPESLYPDVEAWVAGWFAPTFARRLGTTRWCASWWLHAEAIVRLEALWRSWE